MNQSQFEQIHQNTWEEFQSLLEALESRKADKEEKKLPYAELPERYRQLCNHYGLAQTRHYSPALVDRLHNLVLRGHRILYRTNHNLLWAILRFIAKDFPVTLRTHYRLFWLAFLLFYGPAFAFGIATYNNPSLTYSLLGETQTMQMESMYNPENRKAGRPYYRESETDMAMFGYYIFNNISIGLRTFAGGIIFGIGSAFLLTFNGLVIGGVAGHLSHPPFYSVFWQFVCGHGPFELTAIVISGASGLLLGKSLIQPGRYRRIDSMRKHAPTALKLVMGAAIMLVFAAFIEAFWSSMTLPASIKYSFSAANALILLIYFLFAGRGHHAA